MQKTLLFLFFFCFLNACSQHASTEASRDIDNTISTLWNGEKQNFPEPIGLVNDFVNILDSTDIIRLEKKLRNYEKRTTNQVVIVTIDIDTLSAENFDQYTLSLSNYWGVGQKEKNNGLTIVFSPKLRQIRINTGLGTEKVLTDKICERVLQETMLPEFRKGNYFEGLNKGTDEFIRVWK